MLTGEGMMMTRRGVLLLGVVGIAGCSSATAAEMCDAGIQLAGGNCLVFEDGGALGAKRVAIETTIVDATERVNAVMPITGVTIRVRANPAGVIGELGLGGFAPSGREVLLSFDPASPMLPDALDSDLAPMVAHELHHARRWQTVGYGGTLRAAMVSEGLADHFSIEVFGIAKPMWSEALDSAGIESMLDRAEPTWDGPYDHATWFYGTTSSIPRWSGYTVGFELVQRYLAAESSRRASRLYDTEARSFVR